MRMNSDSIKEYINEQSMQKRHNRCAVKNIEGIKVLVPRGQGHADCRSDRSERSSDLGGSLLSGFVSLFPGFFPFFSLCDRISSLAHISHLLLHTKSAWREETHFRWAFSSAAPICPTHGLGFKTDDYPA